MSRAYWDVYIIVPLVLLTPRSHFRGVFILCSIQPLNISRHDDKHDRSILCCFDFGPNFWSSANFIDVQTEFPDSLSDTIVPALLHVIVLADTTHAARRLRRCLNIIPISDPYWMIGIRYMLAHRLRHWSDFKSTLVQHVQIRVFAEPCLQKFKGQKTKLLLFICTKLWLYASKHKYLYNIAPTSSTLVQTLYKCHTNVLCLLGW